MEVYEKIIQLLDESNIAYDLTEHEPVRTSEEAAKVRGVSLSTGAKAMVMKAKNSYYLIVLGGAKLIDWKKLKQALEVKDIRFATEEEAEEITKVQMGSVPPFGNILGLPTYFDQSIVEQEIVNFNVGSRRHSIQMKSKDLIGLVKPILVDIIQ